MTTTLAASASPGRPHPLLFSLLLLLLLAPAAHATFSIVAVDRRTGEVGGAGASCVPDVSIINDLLPGIGAIHTQALHNGGNQLNARMRMLLGDTPQEIMDWLRQNDAGSSPAVRQYGAVTLAPGPGASFTGNQNGTWAGHRTGVSYAIQGNILVNGNVVRDMEQAFLATEGKSLGDRLLAALLAAKRPGADSRCFPVSAQSCFVRVWRIGDPGPYLDIRANGRRTDPLDRLEENYLAWKASRRDQVDPFRSLIDVTRKTVPADGTSRTVLVLTPRNDSDERLEVESVTALHAGTGRLTGPFLVPGGRHRNRHVFFLRAPTREGQDEVRFQVTTSRGTVEIQPPVQILFQPLHHR